MAKTLAEVTIQADAIIAEYQQIAAILQRENIQLRLFQKSYIERIALLEAQLKESSTPTKEGENGGN